MAAHVTMLDPLAEETRLATATMKTQILAPVEILHLETQKKPSSLTYYIAKSKMKKTISNMMKLSSVAPLYISLIKAMKRSHYEAI